MLENSSHIFLVEQSSERGGDPVASEATVILATRKQYNRSRSIEALLHLGNGETEQTYYCIDRQKDRQRQTIISALVFSDTTHERIRAWTKVHTKISPPC